MGDDIQLVDMLESYPSSMTPGFQTLITAKEEFAELASDVGEKLPKGQGNLYKHQKFVSRYLRSYNSLLILDETGTGKSCSVLGFTEYTRRELEKAKIDPTKADEKVSHLKKVVVLVKGPTQKAEFRNQLVCRCSDGRYKENTLVKKAKSAKVRKTNISLELKKAGYSVSTYTSFANRIFEKYSTLDEANNNRIITNADDIRLIEDYSDTIFWIDEAHNLLIDPEVSSNISEKQETYATIWRLLHLVRRCKIIISTATPMINGENEIGSLLNLLLPLNGYLPPGYDYRGAPENDIRVLFPNLPFDNKTATPDQIAPYFRGQFPPDYDFFNATLADLEPFMRGRIGFIRATNTGAIPEDIGIVQGLNYEIKGKQYTSNLTLYASNMSEFQATSYIAARESKSNDELFDTERQAANFIFPDGYWGNGITEEERADKRNKKKAEKAIEKILGDNTGGRGRRSRRNARNPQNIINNPVVETFPEILPEGGILPISSGIIETNVTNEESRYEARAFRRYVIYDKREDSFQPTEEFAPWLTRLDYLARLSCKYAQIVNLLLNEPGNAFVYGEYVTGSGVIVLALCLEGMGFTRFNEVSSIFQQTATGELEDICADRTSAVRRVRPNFLSRQQGAPLRYALLTRNTSDVKFQTMMEAMNSYENRHGDYIKVLISSRVGRDGININNVLQIHLIGPEWNQSAIYQALSRGIRATSHDDLIEEERQRLMAEGDTVTKPTIPIKIYKHAALVGNEGVGSIDLRMYQISEFKDRSIKRMMRIMKQCAIGCQIHYNRNVLPTDVDGSAACDYDICRYPCADPPPTFKDFSNYDVIYASEIISEALRDIINLYHYRNAFTLNDIALIFPKYRKKYLIMALERLITNKIQLIDRFGYTTYLREDKGSFYLDRTYPSGLPPSYAMSYYTQGVIGIEQDTLANITVRLESGETQETLNELETINPADPEFDNMLSALSIEGQAAILENVIMRAAAGMRSNFTDAIIRKFQRMIFRINEPVSELNKVYEQMGEKRPTRGRKRNPDTKRRIKKINPITIDETNIVRDTETEFIYLHTLYSQVINQTGYATTARFNKAEGRIRLLKPSEMEDGWRDLNKIELPVYNAFLQIEIADRNRPFEAQGVYGFILPDKEFRIRDKLTESPGADIDARKIKRGKVCKTWYRPDLIDVMYEIGIPEPGGIFPDFAEEQKYYVINILSQRKINKSYEELETWPFQKLIWYFKWYSATSIKREVLCEVIKQRMAETGRLLT